MNSQAQTPQSVGEQNLPQLAMFQMISGFWLSRAIYVAARLGIADLVKDEPKSTTELAQLTGTHAPSLYRLLRALASVGIFIEDEQGMFSQTPLSETLRSDVPGSMRAAAMVELGQEHFPAWGNVMHSVKTGEIAFNNHFGQDVWEYYAQNPEDAKNFNTAMSEFTAVIQLAVLHSYDFTGIDKIVDVAGGLGGMLGMILQAYPQMRGVLFDRPHVIRDAGPLLDAAGVHDRCELVGGDFFKSLPQGGDAYLLKWIIHDWDDEKSMMILKNCHQAMAENAKLLLIESVVPPLNEPSTSKFLDLNMLVMTGGRERTETEFKDLVASAGFQLARVIPTQLIVSIIEAVRA